MRHLTPADYRQMPWANGRGTTVEMLREEDAVGLSLRLSMATVAEDGPFSALPGIERVLVLLDGPGFVLEIAGARHTVGLLQPVRFAGEAAVAARGVTGPSRDFNVMTRRGAPVPEVAVLRAGQGAEAARLLVFAPSGAELALGRGAVSLGAGDLLDAAGAARVLAGGPVIAVGLG
ncbi:HutD family protein [Solirhodobacter olei]|uniref:HutD/Ves family protein n=1 Tax=Solirhodobacter olei TaxID=2493082 RepID=UPI000FDC00D5|nr:HutD family protein [Solirhodobacter olei]